MSEKLFTFTAGNEPSELVRTLILPAEIVEYESGLEQRNRKWLHARFRFDLRWAHPLDQVVVNSIATFSAEHGGNFESFLYLPSPGTEIDSGQAIGKGNGSRVLFKVYGNRVGSIQAFVNAASVAATYSLGNGTITFATAPASGAIITTNVSSERYVVRFLESQLNHEFFLWKLARGSQVSLIQDKGLV